MAVWPPTVNDSPLIDTFTESRGDNLVTHETDSGVPMTRPRYTKSVDMQSFDLLLTTAEVATLDTFWETTLAFGSLSFDWVHPRTGVTLNAKLSPVKSRPVSDTHHIAHIELKIIP